MRLSGKPRARRAGGDGERVLKLSDNQTHASGSTPCEASAVPVQIVPMPASKKPAPVRIRPQNWPIDDNATNDLFANLFAPATSYPSTARSILIYRRTKLNP
jgi:hypothetical protein